MDTTLTSAVLSQEISALTAPALFARLQASAAPLLIDVRKNAAFIQASNILPGALRRDPMQVNLWAGTLPPASTVLVYCVHGHEVSQSVTQVLRERGIDAHFLHGGIESWHQLGLPTHAKAVASATRWVTRERPKIDRIACPWLICRFIDAQAQFLYVPTAQVQTVAHSQSATAYDVTAAVADTCFTHVGAECSFDAFIRIYNLGADKALARLASIVRGADTDQLNLAAQSAGLLALSLGMSRNMPDDHAMLQAMMPIYDALYAWCRDAVAGCDEQHNWKPA
jgi:rhodanese-related sulfurtransferase